MSSVTSTDTVDVSVVIGFKDWGVERLELAVSSLMASFGDLRGEVIVSDYGSTTCDDLQKRVEALDARYVYTRTDGLWSRSRALNAGFAVSSGRVLVSTDADMLFSPRSMEVVGNRLLADPDQALALQCRDLPEGMGSDHVFEHGLDWDRFEATSTLRPRWGMGGMMAVTRSAFLDVRGFDERMQIYGGEDLDFAQRVRRSGRRVVWVDDPRVRMYHMWHPSSRKGADSTALGRAAIEYNRHLYLHDGSVMRNTVQWIHRPADAAPIVSVVIATKNRAELLTESVHSALSQTVEDLEVLVIDDGSTDDTEKRMSEIADPRLRYLRSPGHGIAAARNFGADNSRGKYTVIHDDDDLMTPDRVEHHLQALRAGDGGTYGGWIDFDDSTGRVVAVNPGKPFSLAALLFSPRVFLHGTLMVDTELLRTVRYDERFRSGSDFDLAVRLARTGVSLRHTGHVHVVRRLHPEQVTAVDSGRQKYAAQVTAASALSLIPPKQQAVLQAVGKALRSVDIALSPSDAQEFIEPYLPDRLVRRDLHVTFRGLAVVQASTFDMQDVRRVRDLLHDHPDEVLTGLVPDASWRTWAQLRAAGAVVRVAAVGSRPTTAQTHPPASPIDHCRSLADIALRAAPAGDYVLAATTSERAPILDDATVGRWRVGDHEVLLTTQSRWAEARVPAERVTHIVRMTLVAPRHDEDDDDQLISPRQKRGPRRKADGSKPSGAASGGIRRSGVERERGTPVPGRSAAAPRSTRARTQLPPRPASATVSPPGLSQLPRQRRATIRGASVVLVCGAAWLVPLCAALLRPGANAALIAASSLVALCGLATVVALASFLLAVRRARHQLRMLEAQRRSDGARLQRGIRQAFRRQADRAGHARRRQETLSRMRFRRLDAELRESRNELVDAICELRQEMKQAYDVLAEVRAETSHVKAAVGNLDTGAAPASELLATAAEGQESVAANRS